MNASATRMSAIARLEWHVLRRDPVPVITYVFMPLVVMAFLKPALRLTTIATDAHGNGAEQAVPGVTVMFAFLLVSQVGMTFFRDHAWRTWDRLRASPASSAEIIAGKVVMPILVFAVVLTCLLGGGGLLLNLHIRGSITGLIVVAAALAMCLVALALGLVAVTRTAAQFVSLSSLGAILCAGLGGALVPGDLLPQWVQDVAPFSPTYWAMNGFHGVITDGWGVTQALRPAAVLTAIAALLVIVAALRFRAEHAKVGVT